VAVKDKKAKFIKQLEGYQGNAALYELSEPVSYPRWVNHDEEQQKTKWVVVSALDSAFDTGISECYIFAAADNGEVVDWGELDGSERGTTNHQYVLASAGYELVK
jgi:hypothetical protein